MVAGTLPCRARGPFPAPGEVQPRATAL